MTTRRPTVRREQIRDWPIFAGLGLSDDLGVLSIEQIRRSVEQIGTAVAEAAQVLASALVATDFGNVRLFLVARGQAVDVSRKVESHNAEKYKLWDAMERSGVSIPEGSRSEARVDYSDGSFGFIGSIEVESGALPVALEVTRRANAVCVATELGGPETLLDDIAVPRAPGSPNALSVFITSVGHLADHKFVARAFGQFDDRVVGAEIFAQQNFLDALVKLFR